MQEDSFYQELCSSKRKWEKVEGIFIIGTLIGLFLMFIESYTVGGILMVVFGTLSLMTLLGYPYAEINEYKETVKQNVLNGDFDDYIHFDEHKLNENCPNKDVVKEAFESLNCLVNQLKQNKDTVKGNSPNNDVKDAFESVDDFEIRIKNKKQEEENRKREEEKRKKEEEWKEYQKRRDQEDFERIERHRIEREKKEKGLNILREEENIKKKEKGKEEQELKQEESREKEERRKWLNEEAFNIQCKLNGNKHVREVAKKISLRVEYLSVQSQKHGLTFKVHWICPSDCTCKEISLIINNGDDVLLYEHLAIFGSQIIELNEAKSIIRITLRFIWLNMPVYKIILIDKE